MSDQQRFDTLSCNGQPLPVTPNIDAAAVRGINFTNAFTMQPVCGPARACLQTGLYPTQTGCFMNGHALPPDCKGIAHYLNDAGYQTAYAGKWHLASGDGPNGYEHYEKTAVPAEKRGGYKDYWMASDVLEFTSHGYDGYVHDIDGKKVKFKGYRTDCITDFAIDFIKSADNGRPFFLFLSHIEPHHQNDRNRFEGPKGSKEKFKNFAKPADLPPGKGDWEKQYPDYLGCCEALDRNFGRVADALKEKGVFDDTLLIYTSDHGCHFKTLLSERAKKGFDDYKRNSFENTIHVPLVISGPGFTGGTPYNGLVSLIDLPRTILTAAGCEIGDEMRGIAIQDMIKNDGIEREDVYVQISECYMGRAVRGKQYKYVAEAIGADPVHESGSGVFTEKYLFDIINDPLEKNNLINDENYDNIKRHMKERLLFHAKDAGEDKFMIHNC